MDWLSYFLIVVASLQILAICYFVLPYIQDRNRMTSARCLYDRKLLALLACVETLHSIAAILECTIPANYFEHTCLISWFTMTILSLELSIWIPINQQIIAKFCNSVNDSTSGDRTNLTGYADKSASFISHYLRPLAQRKTTLNFVKYLLLFTMCACVLEIVIGLHYRVSEDTVYPSIVTYFLTISMIGINLVDLRIIKDSQDLNGIIIGTRIACLGKMIAS